MSRGKHLAGKHLAPRPARSRTRWAIPIALIGLFVMSIPAIASPGGTLLQLGTSNNSSSEFAGTGWTGTETHECTIDVDCSTATFPEVLYAVGTVGFEDRGVSQVTVHFEAATAYRGVVLETDRAGAEIVSIDVNIGGTVHTFQDVGVAEGQWKAGVTTFNIGLVPPGSHSLTFTVSHANGGNGAMAWDSIKLTADAVADAIVSGGGQIVQDVDGEKHPYKISFDGYLYDFGDGLVCDWTVQFHNVSVDSLDKATFSGASCSTFNTFAPGPADGVVNFKVNGTLDGVPGHQVLLRLEDAGEPGSNDTVRVELSNGGIMLYDSSDAVAGPGADFVSVSSNVGTARTELDNGNLQIDY